MRLCSHFAALVALVGVSHSALAQVENADFRIRAQFRTPRNGAWAESQSVGGADFRVHSRFLQLYYGGVRRADDFKFSVSLDFSLIAGFSTQFAGSPYNVNYDIYIENAFVGRMTMPSTGIAELVYDSRHADLPDLPLPANFPEPVDVGQVVRLYAAGGTVPAIGAPRPAGSPIFLGTLGEQFPRGDVNQDRHVDTDDFAVLAARFDPSNTSGPHIGPAGGDFTGDNRCDIADYNVMAANWTANSPVPPPPAIVGGCPADFNADGAVNADDLGDFITCFFSVAPCSSADFNADADVNPDDLGDYITAFFTAC